jgi:hypothetical protein
VLPCLRLPRVSEFGNILAQFRTFYPGFIAPPSPQLALSRPTQTEGREGEHEKLALEWNDCQGDRLLALSSVARAQ